LITIQTGANLGFAGGNNVGIRYALAQQAEYILLLNNDAFFRAPEALSTMLRFMEQTPRAGACGARLLYPDNSPQQSYGNFPAFLRILAYLFPLYKILPQRWLKGAKRSNVVPDAAIKEPLRIDWPSGACLLVRSQTIAEVGLLDEQFFLYLEETDWCYRMQAQGWDRYYLPGAEVIHLFGSSLGKAAKPMLTYHLESQFIYYQKHFSPAVFVLTMGSYLLRSLWSVPYWRLAAVLFSAENRSRALERATYWAFVCKQALTFLGKPYAQRSYQSSVSSAGADSLTSRPQ
jgi:GT2 family glycosyltransferase